MSDFPYYNPEHDPIKEAFVHDEITQQPADSSKDPIDDALARGIITDDEALRLKEIRELPNDVRVVAVRDAFQAIQDGVNDAENIQGGSVLGRYLKAYREHQNITGGFEDFVPLEYFQDPGISGSGLSLEDWQELPESVKDTLRAPKYRPTD